MERLADPLCALLAALCVAACSLLIGCSGGSVDDGGKVAMAALPPEGDDPLNRPVFLRGGHFLSGSDDWTEDYPYRSPFSKADEDVGDWQVEDFWIQQHEVTNGEYRRFDPTHSFPPGAERHPVVNVTWEEAMAYAVSIGGRLPTEVQWEFAARGLERREYPWGNDAPTCALAHFDDCEPRSSIEVMTRPGDVTPDSIFDLAGNVREWVMPVWWDSIRHPVNPDTRRLKGASFTHPAFFLRAAAVTDDLPNGWKWRTVGFRVVWPP